MKAVKNLAAVAACALFSASPAQAQLEMYKDYTVSDAVWSITTVKVDPNMEEYYLEGLKETWVATNKISKELGQIEDYSIYTSDLPQSGSFNMLLIVKFANTSDLAPNKARYDAFMARWGKVKLDESRKTSRELYPKVRTITGDYLMRELKMK